ncbi:hypothetical protein OR1_03807 [Geobacter sp. OR-1]|nr:hypothetical protein OR1_03807 [Geobacter sp. OR-1]
MLDRLAYRQRGIEGVFDLLAHLGMVGQPMLGYFEPGEAGGAGYGQVAVNLFGELQVLGAQGQR